MTRHLDVCVEGRPADGYDPLLTVAVTVLAAHKQAGLVDGTSVISRVHIDRLDELGRSTSVSLRIEVSAPDDDRERRAVSVIERQVAERAARDGTAIRFTPID